MGPDTGILGSYHVHTFRCQHAQGDVGDYARAAVAAGLARLGMADHVPLPDGRLRFMRMALDELPQYESAIVDARRRHPGLHLLQGMECDIFPEYLAWYRDTLLARGYDYLIAGVHFLSADGPGVSAFGCATSAGALRRYGSLVVSAIESRMFAFIAHPDNSVAKDRIWTPDAAACAHDICAAAAAHRTPLELNGLGLRERRGYPWTPFWEIAAQHGCQAVVSSDAHQPHQVGEGLSDLVDLAHRLGLAVVDPFAPLAAARPWSR